MRTYTRSGKWLLHGVEYDHDNNGMERLERCNKMVGRSFLGRTEQLPPPYLIVGHHHHLLTPPLFTHRISPSTPTSTSNPVCPRDYLTKATLLYTRRHVSSPPVSSAQLIPHNWPTVCANISPAISSCAARPQASPSADSATNATANAPSATLTCDRRPWCESAMSAPLGTTRTSVSCAVARASRTHSTASNVRVWRRIETDVPRSSTWAVRGRICSTRRKTSEIIEEESSGFCPCTINGL